MTQIPALGTQCFRDFKPEMGVPVRITRTGPRFKLKYELHEEIKALAPEAHIFGKGLPPAEFEKRYMAQLSRRGYSDILWRLQAVAKRHPGERLVLLCYERVLEGEYCHRRPFARWWEKQTGLSVPELAIDGNTGELTGITEGGLEGVTVNRERIYYGPQPEQGTLL